MFFNFMIVYVTLFVLGIGFARRLTDGMTQLAIAPILGYCFISILSSYFLQFDINRIYLFYSIGVLSLVSIVLVFQAKIQLQWKSLPFLALFFFAIIYIRMNVSSDGQLFFGMNPDVAGYISSGDWLTNMLPLSSLIPGSGSSARYEILHVALRWGFSTNLSIFSLLTKESAYVFLSPVSMIIFFSSMWAAVELFNKRYQTFSNGVKQVVIAMLGMNACILFLVYESFYPNMIGLGLFTLLCVLLIQTPSRKTLVAGIVILGAAITTYSEIFVSFVFLAGLYGLINVVKTRTLFSDKNIYIVLLCLGGLLIIFPLSYQIIIFSFANISNLQHVGYPMPTWLAPSDWVGLTNIFSDFYHYQRVEPHVIGRLYFYLGFTLSVSAWVIFELIKERKHKLLFSTITMLLIIFCINYYRFMNGNYGPINYLYNKISLILASVVTLYFYKSITQNIYKLLVACILTVISTMLFMSPENFKYRGILYFSEMKSIINKYDNDDVAIITNNRGQRLGVMVGQLRYVDRAQDIIWGEYTNKIFDQWESVSCQNFPHAVTIILVAQKKSLKNIKNIKNKIFETDHYIVIDTKKTTKNLCSENTTPFIMRVDKLYVK